ncbi:hypothetical protein [Streptomyces sp. NPDC050704]|uniref:hypothetical protein n=1 Tax=Streptomyces sp. NPDC050704 TaxID=3157219 RepID=UPI00342D5A73
MRWRSAVVTAAWVAVGTGAGGLGAWQLANADGDADAHGRTLDDAAVRRALATGAGSTEPRRSGTPSPTPSVQQDTVRFTGGSATAECRPDGTVYLVSWSPADGYHFDEDVGRGPAPTARLEAEPSLDDDAEDLTYEISCTANGARARLVADADDD